MSLLISCNNNLNSTPNNLSSNDTNVQISSKSSTKNLKKISLEDYNKFFPEVQSNMKLKYFAAHSGGSVTSAFTSAILDIEITAIKNNILTFSIIGRNPNPEDPKPVIIGKKIISVNKDLFWSKLTDVITPMFSGTKLKPISDISIDCGNDGNCSNLTDINTTIGVFKSRHLLSKQYVHTSFQPPVGPIEVSDEVITFDINASEKVGFANMTIMSNDKITNETLYKTVLEVIN